MLGLRLFQHALRMILRNFGFLVQKTLPIWALLVVGSTVLFGANFTEIPDPGAGALPASIVGGVVLSGILYLVATFWIAVIWHRYVLLEENPAAALPPFNGRLIWHYFVTSLVNACCLVPVFLVSGLIAGLFGAIFGGDNPMMLVTLPLAFLLVVWVGFRLGLRLPASAIDKPLRLLESWDKTRAYGSAILTLSVVYLVVLTAVPALFDFLFFGTFVGMIVGTFVDWLAMLLAVSVLTALYGHIVEGREV